MNPAEEPRKYAAFISYRHVMPDMAIAQRLQKMLEHNQVRPNRHAPRNIRPVFLDTGELPTQESLDDSILHALDNSDCLFVICSPELPKSRYCLREIEYFKKIHGGQVSRIYTLLVAGTPQESFPAVLLSENRIAEDENGGLQPVPYDIEPLFADIRAPSLRLSLKKLRKTEYLRLAAAYYGCSFDSLYKRRRRWQLRVGACVIAALLAVFAAFGLYAHFRDLQYDAARAATYASYAEEQIAAGNELLALTLCAEGWDSAQSSGSARYMTALRSAVVQHDFRLSARPAQQILSVESESASEPLFYLSGDGALAMCWTDHFFRIIDTQTGACLQQFPADSIAVDPEDRSVYVYVEAIRNEEGMYQDTLFLRTPDGQLLGSFPFRESTIDSPQYKMITDRLTPDLLTLNDSNETVVHFTRQGELIPPEEAEALKSRTAEPAGEDEPPYYVKPASVLNRSMLVRNRAGETVLDLETAQCLYGFSSDYSMFCYVTDDTMKVFDASSWVQIGETPLPDELLQKVYLLRDTGYALCVFHTQENRTKSILVDWRSQSALLEADGYPHLNENSSVFCCAGADRITAYSYRDMNAESAAEVAAMHENRVLSRLYDAVRMTDALTGEIVWEDSLNWWNDAAHSRDLTRILIPGAETLRCRDETGRLLWEKEAEDACAALSGDGERAAFIAGDGSLCVLDGADGSLLRTIPASAFKAVGPPVSLQVSKLGVAVLGGERSLWFPDGGEDGCELGAYTDAAEADGYLILTSRFAYVMDFAVWDTDSRSVVWQPDENTGLWDWSPESGFLVRHKEISGNHPVSELAVYRLTDSGVEEAGLLPLPVRNVRALRLDSTGQWLSVRTDDAALLYRLATMTKMLETTDCPVYYEGGRLWDWYTFDPGHYSTPLTDEARLYDRALDALTSRYGVRVLSDDERNRYSFSE